MKRLLIFLFVLAPFILLRPGTTAAAAAGVSGKDDTADDGVFCSGSKNYSAGGCYG